MTVAPAAQPFDPVTQSQETWSSVAAWMMWTATIHEWDQDTTLMIADPLALAFGADTALAQEEARSAEGWLDEVPAEDLGEVVAARFFAWLDDPTGDPGLWRRLVDALEGEGGARRAEGRLTRRAQAVDLPSEAVEIAALLENEPEIDRFIDAAARCVVQVLHRGFSWGPNEIGAFRRVLDHSPDEPLGIAHALGVLHEARRSCREPVRNEALSEAIVCLAAWLPLLGGDPAIERCVDRALAAAVRLQAVVGPTWSGPLGRQWADLLSGEGRPARQPGLNRGTDRPAERRQEGPPSLLIRPTPIRQDEGPDWVTWYFTSRWFYGGLFSAGLLLIRLLMRD